MSYRSPIEIVYGDIRTSLENNVYSIVQSYGVNVDKAELIRALEYDRDQYEEGYADGQRDGRTAKVKRLDMTTENRRLYKCLECGQFMHRTAWENPVKFCSYCGARLEWE
ncbi:MAG: hypothetical protein J6W04_00790 [Bacteroidales bacterium]|nr:hypothetical protein [Bacteroidales bacterium]